MKQNINRKASKRSSLQQPQPTAKTMTLATNKHRSIKGAEYKTLCDDKIISEFEQRSRSGILDIDKLLLKIDRSIIKSWYGSQFDINAIQRKDIPEMTRWLRKKLNKDGITREAATQLAKTLARMARLYLESRDRLATAKRVIKVSTRTGGNTNC